MAVHGIYQNESHGIFQNSVEAMLLKICQKLCKHFDRFILSWDSSRFLEVAVMFGEHEKYFFPWDTVPSLHSGLVEHHLCCVPQCLRAKAEALSRVCWAISSLKA
jgi:hypothetical protein